MIKNIFLFLFLSLIIMSCGKKPDNKSVDSKVIESNIPETNKRQLLKEIYTSQIGIKEKGSNRGSEVFKFQKSAGIKAGMPWCGSFVHYCFTEAGIKTNVKGPARASNWFIDKSKIIIIRGEIKIRRAQSGDVIGVSYSKNKIGHVGFFDSENDKFYLTVEGNAGGDKDSPGEGVNRLKRIKRQVLYISNFID